MPLKILAVDDEPDLELLMRQNFRRKIRSGDYIFFFAHNGFEALDTISANPDIDIVFSDINMPEMDGLTLLKNIIEKFPQVKSVIISAYGDMKNLRTAMNNGAFDFVTKPIDFSDLEITLNKTILEVEALKEAARSKDQLMSLQKEMQIGRQIQASFLPDSIPVKEGWEIESHFTPAKEVAGDFYDVFLLAEGRYIAFVVADVCGKGLGAALFMTLIRSLIRAFSTQQSGDPRGPIESIHAAHSYVVQNHEAANMFATVFFGIVDTETSVLRYSSCGHNTTYIVNSGAIKHFIEPNNPLVGLFPHDAFVMGEIQLESGDTIFAFTDGVTDILNPAGDAYTSERVEEDMKQNFANAKELLSVMETKLFDFKQDAAQFDDITMMAVKKI
ncbi:MAG: SpoIIE family protein phosphatase [Ignavibacteriaceae bacterium]|nr:SpoIIE family protein phosphatase [Ignavibacteriaceae bacterium]